tara:strand:+ start:134 stop:781 length:648 start_codon:yes stop_codon:yes gene_type:complete
MTNHPFDLRGVDTGKIGGNKYVNYKLSDYVKDQNITPSAGIADLQTAGYNLGDLKTVDRETRLGRLFQPFLKRDFYLPKTVTDRLAQADKVKTEKENFDPYADLDKLKEFNLDLIREQDKISRKGRIADTGLEMAMMRANLPFIEEMQKRLSTFKQNQLLQAELAKQSMPDAQERRRVASATRFAGELGAVADAYAKAGEVAAKGIRNPTATFSV